MKRALLRLFGYLTLSLIALGAVSATAAADDVWLAPLARDHALVGTIWDVRAGRAIDEATLRARLADAQFVLLGETHDNPDHHRLQARLLDALQAAGRKPALVMEQFDLENQTRLDEARAAPGASAASVAEAARMARSWKPEFYAPLIDSALRAKAPILAANLSRTQARDVMKQGFAALGRGRAGALALPDAWDDAREALMRREIVAGHCGAVPEDLLNGLTQAQRARDALMADALLAAGERGAVGILGRGHVRRDLGAPNYLLRRVPEARVAALAFVEADAALARPQDYLPKDAAGETFDYLWITPRAQRDDPCAGFKLKG